jgi:hypothetical protein
MKFALSGMFTVWKGIPGNMKQVAHFHNHITDYGLNTLFTKSLNTLMGTVHVGSGNTVPADGDTALVTEVANTTNTILDETVSDDNSYAGRRKKYRFTAGEATGTLAELGVSDGTSLFNRQLFKDHDGNATTITVGAAEVLDILCEIRGTFAANKNTKIACGNVTINGQVFDHMCSFVYRCFLNADGLFPLRSINYYTEPSIIKAISTTADFNDGSSGFTTTENSSGIVADAVTQSSYVADSFEYSFEPEWYAGTLDGRYDGLLIGGSYFILGIGLSPTYNTAAETEWQDSHAYTVGDKFISALGDEFIYEVITGGTSHTSAPVWPTTVGGTVTDGGGVEYECVAPLLVVAATESLKLTVKYSWGRA